MVARDAADDASDDNFEPPHPKRGKKATKSRFRAPGLSPKLEDKMGILIPEDNPLDFGWSSAKNAG